MQRGFVDAHVHVQGEDGLRDVAAAGVVAVRDAGTKQGIGLNVGRQGGRGNVPAVISAGWALFKKGGYGSAFGIPVERSEDFESEIHKLKAAGAGIIKAMASGMVSIKNPGTMTPGGFEREDLIVLVREAERHGLHVMAHANGEEAIIASAEAGVRSLEHGFYMTDQALDVLAKRGLFWVPTVGALARAAESGGSSRDAREYIADVIKKHLVMIGKAHAMGVPLALGTDCVLPDARYRDVYDRELRYFEQAGILHDEVVRIACEGGAKLLGLRGFKG